MLEFIKVTSEKNGKKIASYRCSHCGNIEDRYKDNVSMVNNKKCKECNNKDRIKPLPSHINGIEVLEDLGMNNKAKRKRVARFRCECGESFVCIVNAVKTGSKLSCGCAYKKANTTHGLSEHKLYRKWSGMITRVTDENGDRWHRYGGRGITICDEWRNDFLAFYTWAINNGYKEGLTLDRRENDGNYEPSNCQWITMLENSTKDSLKFNPSEETKEKICKTYKETHITITRLAEIHNTWEERISNILKENNIQIIHRRMKCYQ